MVGTLCAMLLLSGVEAPSVAAPTPIIQPGAPRPIRWDPPNDIPLTAFFVGSWIAMELAKDSMVVPGCRWCETNAFDTAVRRIFNPTLTPSPDGMHGADMASNVFGFAVLPLTVAGLDVWFAAQGREVQAALVDITLIVQASFAASLVNQVAKFAVLRARPFSIGQTGEQLTLARDPADTNLSFFGGHTTFAFSLVASASTIAYLRGYKNPWLMWTIGVPLATTVMVLRLAADKHWATDQLIGITVGSAFGVLIPLVFHSHWLDRASVQLLPGPGGLAIAGRF